MSKFTHDVLHHLGHGATDRSIDFYPAKPNQFDGHDVVAQDGSGWTLRIAHQDTEANVDLYVFDRPMVVQRSANVRGAAPETVAAMALLLWEDAAA